jgi:DNA-binding NarL/FixJ family response regulator
MKRPRVLLADDHKIVVEGLRSLLEPEFELVGTVEDGRALVAAAEELAPDVIVADISMPLLNGIEALRQLGKKGLATKVIFLTMQTDVTYTTRALDAGACGYVLKHAAPSELILAIREVLKDKIYVTPMLLKNGLQNFMEDIQHRRKSVLKLTPRQREVLQLLAEGRSAKEVGGVLNISTRTVEFHKYRMMQDLQLQTNAELVQYAIKHGIVSV